MSEIDSAEHSQQLIKHYLRHGKRRKKELEKISCRNKTTIHRHVKKLVDRGEVIKEKSDSGKVFYYLPDGRKAPIRSFPSANDEKVRVLLDVIESEWSCVSEKVTNDSWSSDKIEEELFPEAPEYLGRAIHEFEKITDLYDYVLKDDINLKKFLNIFDNLISIFDPEEGKDSWTFWNPLSNLKREQRRVTFVVSKYYHTFFSSVLSVYQNWLRGRENERIRKELKDRLDRIIQNSVRMSDDFVEGPHAIVTIISVEKGHQMFKRMIRGGTFHIKTYDEVMTTTYERNNQLHVLIDVLDDLENKLDGSQKDTVIELRQRIRQRYGEVDLSKC